jgi:tRNA uridine 5-carbamoylmethylation protein Kti12
LEINFFGFVYHYSTIMALVTIVGFPCCGKSTRAKQIKEYLEKRIQEESTEGPKLSVVLVDDDNSHVLRSTYDSKYRLSLKSRNYHTELTV